MTRHIVARHIVAHGRMKRVVHHEEDLTKEISCAHSGVGGWSDIEG